MGYHTSLVRPEAVRIHVAFCNHLRQTRGMRILPLLCLFATLCCIFGVRAQAGTSLFSPAGPADACAVIPVHTQLTWEHDFSVGSGTGGALYSIGPGQYEDTDDQLRQIDPSTGATISSVTVSMAGYMICGGNGLATDPCTGDLWAVLKIDDGEFIGCWDERQLAIIDPATGIATDMGTTGDLFAGLAFDGAGTLYGVTGDGNLYGEQPALFEMSTSGGFHTLLTYLGNGINGEGIGFNPNDQMMYHCSGAEEFDTVFEKIDLDTYQITDISIYETPLEDGEARGLTWWPEQNVFLWIQGNGPDSTNLYSVTPDGSTIEFIGQMDHKSKGIAFLPGEAPTEGCDEQGPGAVNLYYTCEPAAGGGWDYDFTLRVDTALAPGTELDWIIFFDDPTATPIENVWLVGPAPAPFTGMGGISGYHNGASFVNSSIPGWQPTSVGDTLEWSVHADNLVQTILWSELESQTADFKTAIRMPLRASSAAPVNLYYTCQPAVDGGYDYDFTLRVDAALPPSPDLNWIIFFDKRTPPSPVQNPVLVGPAPAPFTGMGGATGSHNGPSFVKDPAPGWQPTGIGDALEWSVHADNLVVDVLWSNFVGDPRADFRPAIKLDTYDVYLDSSTPPTTALRRGLGEMSCDPTEITDEPLESCSTYYWQVVYQTTCGAYHGPIWSFKTTFASDLDLDSTVDLNDFALFSAAFSDTGCGGPDWCAGTDLDASADVDLTDAAIFFNHFLGECPVP